METLKNFILQQVYNHNVSKEDAKRFLEELEGDKQEKDIAIIGIAGKFPMAENIEQYWDNLLEKRNGIREYPKGRYKMTESFLKRFFMKELIEDNCIDENGNLDMEFEHRGYLESIDQFDAEFFGITPREARAMDPDQRMFLQIAYEAMEDAGYCKKTIYGKKVGVFVGIDHVEELNYKKVASKDPMVVTGTWPGVLAGRISYIFDFKAPSMVIDTACSSGLVSVHEGCRAIRNGECEMAVCGGLSSFIYYPYSFSSQLKELESIETEDDMIRTFDNQAKGTTWGEGVGALLLKPLDKAIADGDLIHAVIKGSAINNDGASNGLTAPNVDAQQQLLMDAWKDARVDPETIQYIEAHGTGTVLGDPIEIKAMTNAFRNYTTKAQFCGVGSVKPNIGHLVGASGIASIIKVIKMLENNVMLPSVNFDTPNRFINFVNSPIYINDKVTYWEKKDTPRRAGVNSFGFSGTNCHVVLEEAAAPIKESTEESSVNIFTISAEKQSVLHELVGETLEYLKVNQVNMKSACYTSNCCRGHYGERLAIVVRDQADLINKLEYVYNTDFDSINKFGVSYGKYKVVSENKQDKEVNDITEGQQRKFTKMSQDKIVEYVQTKDYPEAFELCSIYVKGADVDWKQLYANSVVRKVRLPVYPLEKKAFWYEDADEINVGEQTFTRKFAFLIDKLAAKTMYGDIYTTQVSPKTHWILSDHIILGQNIIPGTTYVEMTCELMRQYYGSSIHIDNLVFYSPCIVGKEDTREIQSMVVNNGNSFDVTFLSCNVNNEWEKHAECSVHLGSQEKKKINLEELRNEIRQEEGKAYIREECGESEISLGARWQNEQTDTRGKNSVLCKMTLQKEMRSDLVGSFLHVAMFDNSINAVSQDIGEGLYLPYFYKNIEFYDEMPPEFYSHIMVKTDSLDEELDTISYDVDLIKEDGTVFAQIRDYSTKKVNIDSMKKIRLGNSGIGYYSTRWIQSISKNTESIQDKTVLLMQTDKAYMDKLKTELESSGLKVILVSVEDKFQNIDENNYTVGTDEKSFSTLFNQLKGIRLDYIVYSALQDTSKVIEKSEQLKEHLNQIFFGIVNLTKAYLKCNFTKEVRFITVGTKAYKVLEDDMIAPENAIMGALMKSISIEYENIRCKYIDLDPADYIGCMKQELLIEDYAHHVAYRNGERYIEELYKTKLENKEEYRVIEGSTYLITGGTGGIGLSIAEHIAAEKLTIILVNRSKYPERERWDEVIKEGKNEKLVQTLKTIQEIEKKGTTVELYQADISVETEVQALADHIETNYKKLEGIFHCAGNAGDGMLLNRSLERMDSVIMPKVCGTYLLDQYTRKLQPEFMLLFSSMLTIFGDVGQADYMSANTYMDAFAEYRNQAGLKTKVVNWPAWREVGMAVAYDVVDTEGFIEAIGNADAMQVIAELLMSDQTRVMAGKLNYGVMKQRKNNCKMEYSMDIQNQLNNTKIQTQKKEVKRERKVVQYNSEYSETENKLYQIWSDVLEVDKLDIYDNFSSLGGDSFLAIQLYKEIDKEYPNVIEVSDIFTYPMISKMASYIDKKTGKEEKVEKKSKEDKVNENIDSLMEMVKSGSTSIEDAVNMLSKL